MLWTPEPTWEGQDAFIIGGGDSLRQQQFDWNLLIEENAVGCNSAFRLGPEVCDVCVFADRNWILPGGQPRKGYYDKLSEFPNLVVTNDPQLKIRKEPWIKWMPRKHHGLWHDALGYNYSSAAVAINVALLLGAKTIYLLGIDMQLGEKGRANWHDYQVDKANAEIYIRMMVGFSHVRKDLVKFPNSKVINVTDCSKLTAFPIIGTKQFWQERKLQNARHIDASNTTGNRDGRSVSTVDTASCTNAQANTDTQKVAG